MSDISDKFNDIARVIRMASKESYMIEKIKLVRLCTGLGLKEAMDLVKRNI